MKKFVIVTDSCSDLSKELREKYNIDYIPMHVTVDGQDYPADLDWGYISYKDYYDIMRKGTRIYTAQVNESEYNEVFEKYIAAGADILSISCSSALSASYKGSCAVRDKLHAKYPDSKIYCVDSLNSCFGLGLLCIAASRMRAEGKTIEEVYDWLEKNKLRSNQLSTVESLSYLARAGRVSGAKSFFGNMFDMKPIIISDKVGQNNAIVKIKGRKTSIKHLAKMFAECYESDPYQLVCVADADCPQDGELLQTLVEQALSDKNVEIITGVIGPIIGASAGPGTIAVYCLGKEVTV